MTAPPTATDELRQQLRAAIRASGVKQIWIAEQLGVSQKHLSQMLTGRVGLPLDWAQSIAALCGYTATVTIGPAADAELRHQLTAAIKALGRSEAELVELRATIARVLAVAEAIEANGIGWAADSVRRACKGELE